jgi:hypothetical protein
MRKKALANLAVSVRRARSPGINRLRANADTATSVNTSKQYAVYTGRRLAASASGARDPLERSSSVIWFSLC